LAQVSLGNVTKKFGNTTALKDLSLEIHDKEFFVLLGPTGAGKTTTLRCIAGLEKPDHGSIHIEGQDVLNWGPAERDVALVFQYYSLYPHYTVRQNLEFPLKSRIRKTEAEEIDRRVGKVAETLRIGHLLNRKTDKLSGGEMQRVAIGRAIVRDPKIFLMDEPLSNLDAKLRELLRSELKDLQMNLGATFLYVTHDQVEAMTMAERIGILNKGNLIQIGTPYDVYNYPVNTYVAAFVGTPTMNLFDGWMQNNKIIIMEDAFELELNARVVGQLRGLSREVKVGFRPEDVSIRPEGGCEAQIYGVENMGMSKIVTLMLAEHRVKVTADAGFNVDIDAKVRFQINQEKLYFFSKETGENLLLTQSRKGE
jgi:multiple sugar transport system ATP-binding protein